MVRMLQYHSLQHCYLLGQITLLATVLSEGTLGAGNI
jgi:hypothetical protein